MRKIGKITGTAPIGYLNVKNEDEHSEIILDGFDDSIFTEDVTTSSTKVPNKEQSGHLPRYETVSYPQF